MSWLCDVGEEMQTKDGRLDISTWQLYTERHYSYDSERGRHHLTQMTSSNLFSRFYQQFSLLESPRKVKG